MCGYRVRYVSISGPISDPIQLYWYMSVCKLTSMALSSGMPGGPGPTAGNGSVSQDLLYSSCVILIQSGMLGRKLAYGPVAWGRWEVQCPVLSNLSNHQHPFDSHHLPPRHCLEQWEEHLLHATHIKIISYTMSCTISDAISFFPIFLPCCWRYDIGYDIVATYDILYDIVPDASKIHFLALRCDFFSRYPTRYRGFFTFNIGIYGVRIRYRIRL